MLGRFAQDAGAHHRRQRQRNDGRNDDGNRQRQCELAKHPSDDAGHEKQWNEDGDQREGQRNDGETDLPCPLQRRFHRIFAILDVSGDILDHDDGVVDDEACADRQRHQRQVVEAEAGKPHHAECRDQRERQCHRRDDGCRDRPQEHEDDQDDQADAERERPLHVVIDARIVSVLSLTISREIPAGSASFRRGNCVSTSPTVWMTLAPGWRIDVDDDSGLALIPGADTGVLQSLDDIGDVLQQDRRIVAVGDDDRFIDLGIDDLVVRGEREGLVRAVERTLGAGDAGSDDGAADILERQPVGGKARQIGLDANRPAARRPGC